ncbi:MAG TPA: amidohydrolase [Chitinophagaceae bacterium]|nr:amidohydrolase [Chitinophagaceae bacterium]
MRKRSIINYLPAAILFFLSCNIASQNSPAETAELVINNAKVYTVNKNQPDAEALAVKDGKIIFVGTNTDVKKYIGDKTEVIDAKGQFVMPGFIEGHGHIHGLGASLVNLNLMNVKNWDEIVAMVADAVKKAKPGDWIVGRGWHQEKWNPAPAKNYLGYPYHEELDKVSPNNAVILSHASGHSIYVNAKAMEQAGITSSTKSPTGGEILKDNSGKIVGVFSENAMGLIGGAYSAWEDQQSKEVQIAKWQHSIQLAEEDCLKKGVTSFEDAGSSFEQVEGMKQLAQQGKLNIRHWLMVREDNATLRAHANVFPIINEGNGFLTVKAVKVSLDGALGSYGAWLLEPYTDRPSSTGENTFNIDSLKAIADFCWQNNLQLCVHAIGDRANREVINIYAEQIAKDKNKDHRWRVEHAQHVNPLEIPRFKEWNVIASMQGIHCTSDAPFVPKRLGAKRSEEGAYVWQSFIKAGVLVNNGTDVPVEDEDPIPNFYASVTRKLKDGTEFYPAQKMTREQALYSYTMANAIAAFQEKDKGSLEVGKYADIVILSNDLMNCKDEEIKNTKVVTTIVGGKVKYKG